MALVITRNTTPGAPSLAGQPGQLIAVLDFALVTRAGWVKTYTGTNKAVYRPPAGVGNQRYLRVDDTSGMNAGVVMYESMTGVDTGSGLCPTEAMYPNGARVAKSSTADTVQRAYFIGVLGSYFILWIGVDLPLNLSVGGSTPSLYVFGDFRSYKAGDEYNTVVAAGTGDSYTTTSANTCEISNSMAYCAGLFIQRPSTQIGTSIYGSRLVNTSFGYGQSSLGSAGPDYPSLIDGGLHMSRVYIGEATNSTRAGVRGYLPGIWSPLHTYALQNWSTFSGSGAFAGKTFQVFRVGNSAQACIETSDTWLT